MGPGLIWILAGLALLGAELALPGVFLLWIGLAAIGTGLFAWAVTPAFLPSVLAFLALLTATLAIGITWQRRRGTSSRINAPEEGLAGRVGTVIDASEAGLRVRLGDSDWAARPATGVAPPAPGTVVRVEGVAGTVLVVRPMS